MFNTSSFNCVLKTTYIPLVSSPFASLVTSRWPLKLKLRLCSKRGSPGAKTSPPSPVPVEPKAPPLEDPRAGVPNPPVRLGVPNPVVALRPVAPKVLVPRGAPNVEPDVRLVLPSPVVVVLWISQRRCSCCPQRTC